MPPRLGSVRDGEGHGKQRYRYRSSPFRPNGPRAIHVSCRDSFSGPTKRAVVAQQSIARIGAGTRSYRPEPAPGTGPTRPRGRVKSPRNRPAAAGNFAEPVGNLMQTKARRERIRNRAADPGRTASGPGRGPGPARGKPRQERGGSVAGAWPRTGRSLVAHRPDRAATQPEPGRGPGRDRAGNAGPKLNRRHSVVTPVPARHICH